MTWKHRPKMRKYFLQKFICYHSEKGFKLFLYSFAHLAIATTEIVCVCHLLYL